MRFKSVPGNFLKMMLFINMFKECPEQRRCLKCQISLGGCWCSKAKEENWSPDLMAGEEASTAIMNLVAGLIREETGGKQFAVEWALRDDLPKKILKSSWCLHKSDTFIMSHSS